MSGNSGNNTTKLRNFWACFFGLLFVALPLVLIFTVGLPLALVLAAVGIVAAIVAALVGGALSLLGTLLKIGLFVVAPIVLLGYLVTRLVSA